MFQYQSYRRPKLPRFDFRFGFRLLRLHPPREAHRSKAASGAALAQAYSVVTGELRKGGGIVRGVEAASHKSSRVSSLRILLAVAEESQPRPLPLIQMKWAQ